MSRGVSIAQLFRHLSQYCSPMSYRTAAHLPVDWWVTMEIAVSLPTSPSGKQKSLWAWIKRMVNAFALRLPGVRPHHAWRAYERALERRPLATKVATSMVGFALGDALCQLTNRPQVGEWHYDVARTARLAAFGGAVGGPIGHYWFNFLDRFVMPGRPTSPLAIASKIVLDQTINAPLGTALFFAATKTMEMHPEQVPGTIQEKLFPTVATGWKLWPAAHIINFAFVPLRHRILYINVISIAWTYVLSKATA